MATWKLSPQHKKSAETHTFMRKGDARIRVVEGFRWGSVTLTTEGDEPPVIDLVNTEGVNTYDIPDTEWELESFDDGWYSDIDIEEGHSEISEEEMDELLEKFGEDGIYGLEEDGWEDEGECEWWFFGPLQLEDEDGNVVGQGEPTE